MLSHPWPHVNIANKMSSSSAFPPNFLGALLETSNYLDAAAKNPEISKEEICKSMESRVSLLLGKMVSAPTGGSFSVFNRGDDGA